MKPLPPQPIARFGLRARALHQFQSAIQVAGKMKGREPCQAKDECVVWRQPY